MNQAGQKIEESILLLLQNKMKFFLKIFKGAILAPFFISCALTVTRPTLEMEFAKAAFDAAQSANADRFDAANYRKAEVFYFKAREAYKRKKFDKAKKYAKTSLYYSERAEFYAIKRQAFNNEEIDEFE